MPEKHAFILGVNQYDNFSEERQLINAVSDAEAVAACLDSMAFNVHTRSDLSRSEFLEDWGDFLNGVSRDDTVVFYFSGHGVSLESQNYLLPRSMPFIQHSRSRQIKGESLSVDELLLDIHEKEPRLSVMILDACRNDPLIPREYQRDVMGSGGLSRLDSVNEEGTLIIYAAGAGKTALDRLPGETERHSVFTRHLIDLLPRQDIDLIDMFYELRTRVDKTARQRGDEFSQRPAHYGDIDRGFTLTGPVIPRESESVDVPTVLLTPRKEAPAVIKTYHPGDVFRDGDGFPEMVVVPAGSFEMGSNKRNIEQPVHTVTFDRPFAIGVTPMTFDEYEIFVAATGRNLPDDEDWGRGDRPVIDVSWEDATACAEWISEKTGDTYRLPTEAEWEYAARAGTTTENWWGDDITTDNANYGYRVSKTTEVKSYSPNPFGLYDTAGNVWEWTEDCWHKNYVSAPDNGSAWLADNGGVCESRVLRGGSWSNEDGVRSAYRYKLSRYFRSHVVGFRLTRTL